MAGGGGGATAQQEETPEFKLLRDRLAEAESGDDDAFVDACDLLLRLVDNVVKNPAELKFRRIREGNATISTKLLSVKGMRGVVLALGWEPGGDPADASLQLPDGAAGALAAARGVVWERREWVRLRDARAAVAEREAAFAARQAELRRISGQMQGDRESQKERPKAQTSVATARAEGGTKKFEPARGG